jgi:cysteine synthase B
MPALTILDMIGNTPVLDVSVLSPNPAVRLLAKMEGVNPFGSLKDRVAKTMITRAVDAGLLRPGQRILAPSSGNMGIALAGIGSFKGHPVTVVMPASASRERWQALAFFGAEVVLTAPEEGTRGAIRRAKQLAEEHPEWCLLDQYSDNANPETHYATTGPEIWQAVPGITHFVVGLGSGGTIAGVGRFLKEMNPQISIVLAEPERGCLIEGVRNLADGNVPLLYGDWNGPAIIDQHRTVGHFAALQTANLLARKCGIFAGPSSGLALAAALDVAGAIERGTILFLACDSGWKYLSQTDCLDRMASAEGF